MLMAHTYEWVCVFKTYHFGNLIEIKNFAGKDMVSLRFVYA